MAIYLTEDNFKVIYQYFSFQCVPFLSLFDWKNMIFLNCACFFVVEFEARLPCINDLLKACPLGKHYSRVAFSKICAQKFTSHPVP